MNRMAITVALLLWAAAGACAEAINVSAAISLKESLQNIAREYETATGDQVVFNFGASGQLMAQIEQGAPVDMFISAAQNPVDRLRKQSLLAEDATRTVVRNQLVLITPPRDTRISGFASLASGEVQRIALGQPKTVPAGEYATQVLQKLGVAETLQDRIIYGANVRQVLDYVVRGEVDAGLVYSSDARQAQGQVRLAAVARADWHQPIVYPAAVIRASAYPAAARRFLDYLVSEPAQEVFVQHGFLRAAPAGQK